MRDTAPLSAMVFAVIGVVLLVLAIVLSVLGSFAFIAVVSVGMFFIAAAIIARAIPSPGRRGPAVLALAALALIVFGMVATPFIYAGWGLLAGAVLLALLNRLRATTLP